MKKNLFIKLLLASVAVITLTFCTKPESEPQPPVPAEREKGVVRFTLNGACDEVDVPEGAIAVSEAERTIKSLDALLFKGEVYDTCISLKHVNREYSFERESGDYEMLLVANGDETFKEKVSSLTQDKTTKEEALSGIIIKPTANEDGAGVMISEPVSLSISKDKETKLEIEMLRPWVRVDILSGVDGLTIESLKIENACTALLLNGSPAVIEDLLDADIADNSGTHEEPAVNIGAAYIFPLESTKMTMEYTFKDENANVAATMKEDNIEADMIWGFTADYEKSLEIGHIIAEMNEGYVPEFSIPATEYGVGVALMGATEIFPNEMNAIVPYKYECSTERAIVAFFKNNETLYSVVEGERYGKNMYRTIIHDPGYYGLIVIANAPESLKETLLSLPEGEIDMKTFRDIVSQEEPRTDGDFLMVGESYAEVGNDWISLKVDVLRLQARIDMINGVPGMVISKVTFKNRGVKTSINHKLFTQDMVKDTEYTDFEGEGDIVDYSAYVGKIYSYANTSSEYAPEIVVDYTLNGTEGSVTADFSAVGGVEAGKLYSVVLSGKETVGFEVAEENWVNGYNPKIGNEQEMMNAALAVNRFAAYNVMSIDGRDVTFCTSNTDNTSGFFSIDNYDTKEYTGSDGHLYRVPSSEEMMLLLPGGLSFNFNKGGTSKTITEQLPDILLQEYSGGVGTSSFMSQKVSNSITGSAYYAIRFKGTEQCAAYRYEMLNTGQPETVVNIKIKAMPKDCDTDVMNIIDMINPDFWKSDYIEFNIPVDGAKLSASKTEEPGYVTTLWTSDDVRQCMWIDISSSGLYDGSQIWGANLRMVRVD